jgi:hypothetical protein
MDISRIPPVFVEQISLCDWNSDVTRDDLIAVLGDYPVYQEIIVAYVDDDDSFSSPEEVISAVPDQAWQDAQNAAAGDQQTSGAATAGSQQSGQGVSQSAQSQSAQQAGRSGDQAAPPPGSDQTAGGEASQSASSG